MLDKKYKLRQPYLETGPSESESRMGGQDEDVGQRWLALFIEPVGVIDRYKPGSNPKVAACMAAPLILCL